MLRIIITTIIFLPIFLGNAQVEVISTGTTVPIWQLIRKDSVMFISSPDGYLAKCRGNCDNLEELVIPNPLLDYNQTLQVIDSNIVFALSGKQFPNNAFVYRSLDGGDSWDLIMDSTDIFAYDFVMFDTLNGTVFDSFYERRYTVDGGNNWVTLTDWMIVTTGTFILDDSVAFAGRPQGMMRTTDKGVSWNGALGYGNQQPIDIFALSEDSIFVVSRGGTSIHFSYCFNLGAEPWVSHYTNFRNNALCYKSLNEIYVAGGQGGSQGMQRAIFKTTDLGVTWEVFNFQEAGELLDMALINDSTAMVSGSNGYLAKWSLNSPMGWLELNDVDSALSFEINPNPASTSIKIEGASLEAFNVKINNSLGQNIHFIENYTSKSEIDISSLPSGVYSISIENSPMIKRFVKQ